MEAQYQLEMPWESDAMEDAHSIDRGDSPNTSDSYAVSFHDTMASSPFHGLPNNSMPASQQQRHQEFTFQSSSESDSFMDLEDKDRSSPVSVRSPVRSTSISSAMAAFDLTIPEHAPISHGMNQGPGPLIASTVDTEAVPANLNPRRAAVGHITNASLMALWQARDNRKVKMPRNPLTGTSVDMGTLVQHVNAQGGVEYVEAHQLWKGILERMGLPSKDQSFVNAIKSFYAAQVVPLERSGCLPIPPPKISLEKRRASNPTMTPMTPRSAGVLVATAHTDAHPTMATALDEDDSTMGVTQPLALRSPVMAVTTPNVVTMARASSPTARSEKRLKAYRTTLSRPGWEGFRRALGMTLYIMASDESNLLERRYRIFDGTNNLIVVIGALHQCSCLANAANAIEYDDAHGALCPHMVWVCHKVLKLPTDNTLLYQSSLTPSELRQVFAVRGQLKQKTQSQIQPADMMFGQLLNDNPFSFPGKGGAKDKAADDECGLCFEHLGALDATCCGASSGCGKSFHQKCFHTCVTSRVSSEQATCPSCHCLWKENMPVMKLPLSSLASLSASMEINDDTTPRGLVGLPSAGLSHHEPESLNRGHMHEDAYNDNFGSLLSFDMVNLPRTSF